MSKQELLNLIHQTVCDSFQFYQNETIKSFNALINAIQSSQNGKNSDLQEALFNYTMETSETICIAMAKILISAGILNISESDG